MAIIREDAVDQLVFSRRFRYQFCFATLQGDRSELKQNGSNNDFSFGGRPSLPETGLDINSVLPTLQGDRTDFIAVGNPLFLNDYLP